MDGTGMKLSTLKPVVKTVDVSRGSRPATERIRGRKLGKVRERIAYRDEYTCRECGRVDIGGQVDHKTPLHLGGAESDENRQWLCQECHKRKTEREQADRGGG